MKSNGKSQANDLRDKIPDDNAGRTAAALIVLLLMGVYLFLASRSTLWDRDEGWYARATAEMLASGNYLVPTFNGQLYADKPILLYWLMSVPVRLFGPSEMACRFWSAVGTAMTALLTFFIGKRLFGPQTGLWAMVILASSLMIMVTGTLAITEGPLLPLMVAALAVFLHANDRGCRAWHIVLMGLALGAGMLAKGPIGLLPVPALAMTLYLGRRTGLSVRRHIACIIVAVILGTLIFLAWAIPANNATQGEFLRTFIGRDVLHRAMKPMEHHGGNLLLYLLYYPLVIILGFFPWVLHLPGALSAALGGRLGGPRGQAVLIGWIVPIPVLMTLAATKLPHYILFIWPGLALAVASTLLAARQGKLNARDQIWLRRGIWFFAPTVCAAAFGLMIGPWFFSLPGLRWSGFVSGAVLSAMAIIAIRNQHANRPEASAKALLAGMILFQIPYQFGVLPAVECAKITPHLAQAVNQHTAKDVAVATYGFDEPTLNFYIGRQIKVLKNEDEVMAWTRQPQQVVLVITRDRLRDVEQHHGSLALHQIACRKGLNYSKGRPQEVVALVRKEGFR